jgi:hypothetical protein
MTTPTANTLDVAELARQIAVRMSPDALLDAADVAAMLKYEPRYVTEQLVLAPGFPKPIRLTGPEGRRGQPRWLRASITDWIASHAGGASKRGGRPRNQPD